MLSENKSGLTVDQIRTGLSKILESEAFRTSDAQRNFLRYAVEQTLAGRAQDIKEYTIATEALGKGESFDSRLDAIVRIQAGKLRSRLTQYYATEGANDPLRIDLPKGSYAPVFLSVGDPPAIEPPELTRNESVPAASLRNTGQTKPQTRTRWKIVGPIAALAMLVAFGLGRHIPARPAVLTQVSPSSIAIPPFQNLSESRDDQFFSDGLTEELIDSMARLPGVVVIGKTSAFEFRGQAIDFTGIRAKLGAGTVLQGAVRRYDDRVRVTVQLNETTRGAVLWSQTYDREAEHAVAIQTDIARAITDEFRKNFARSVGNGPEDAGVAADRAIDPKVYEAYLKGRYFFDKRTPKSNEMALGYFQQAVKLDPQYAPAWSGIAEVYVALPSSTAASPSEVIPKITAAAKKALEFDPHLGQPHVYLAFVASCAFDWAVAEKEFQTALALSPGDASVHAQYGEELMITGNPEKALREDQIALSLDPISPSIATSVASALRLSGHLDDSIRQFQKALILDPNYGMTRQYLAYAYLQKHMYIEAIAQFQKAIELMDNPDAPGTRGTLAFAYARVGRTAEARSILNEVLPLAKQGRFPASAIGKIYYGLGDIDNAFVWFEKAIDDHRIIYLKSDPNYDALRSDPRFPRLLRKMNLQ